MSNPYAEFDEAPAPRARPQTRPSNPYADLDLPQPRPEESWGDWTKRHFQTADDFVRALASTATFGAVDRLEAFGSTTMDEVRQRNEEARERSPWASVGGDIVGYALPAALASRALAGTGRLAGTGLRALATREGIVGATDSLVRSGANAVGNIVDGDEQDETIGEVVGEAAIAGGASAVLAPAFQAVTRFVSPTARARHSGVDMSPEDRAAAVAFSERSRNAGIPLSVPEATAAAAPASSARVQQVYQTAAASPRGSVVATNFDRGRLDQVRAAINGVVDQIGPGVRDGTVAQDAASTAMRQAQQLVDESSRPYYRRSQGHLVTGGKNFYRDPAIAAAWSDIQRDPILKAELGRALPHSIKALDDVLGRLNRRINEVDGKDPEMMRLLVNAKTRLQTAMRSSSADWETGRSIQEQGRDMLVRPLGAGPLGDVARTTNPRAQTASLFDVAGEAADQSVNAIKRMDNVRPGTGAELASTRLREFASRATRPQDFARALPTDESVDVLLQAIGRGPTSSVEDTLAGVRAIGRGAEPAVYDGTAGIMGEVYRGIRGLGGERVARLMQDPEFVHKLNEMGLTQYLFQGGVTGSTSAIADGAL